MLADGDLHDLARFGDALGDLACFEGIGGLALPRGDAALDAELAAGRGPGGSFYLADAFAPALGRARAAAAAAQAACDAARGALAERAARATGLAAVRDGEFVVMRDTLPDPFPPEIRVLREAPTYVLCELALDADAVAALATRDAAVADVASAEEDVRRTLSAQAARAASTLFAACERLGDIDLLAARAAFAARHDGTVPDLRPGSIDLELARLPPSPTAWRPSGDATCRSRSHRRHGGRDRSEHGRQDRGPADARILRRVRGARRARSGAVGRVAALR